MMETRMVHTIDVPSGFIVLDHIVGVELSPPAMQIQSYEAYYYSVDALTKEGTRVHLRSFPIDLADPACVTIPRGPRSPYAFTYEVPAIRVEAEAFMAEIRYCIEHP